MNVAQKIYAISAFATLQTMLNRNGWAISNQVYAGLDEVLVAMLNRLETVQGENQRWIDGTMTDIHGKPIKINNAEWQDASNEQDKVNRVVNLLRAALDD